jgi:putative membrane protein
MMWGYNGFGAGGMGLGMLLFWGVIIALVVFLFGRLGATRDHATRATPLDILRERYARGEIGKAEFDEKRRELGAE